jgi:ribonucleoside-triphosphate reductase
LNTNIGIEVDWQSEKIEDFDYFSNAPLGQLVYDRTYSRIMENGKKETWPDTVARVVDGNLNFVDPQFIEPNEREELYNLLLNRQLIPAGRHLWVTGVPGRSFTQNCHVAGFETGFADHCGFVFSELMKGGGVGANYSSRYLSTLTPLSSVEVRFICSPEHADFNVLLPLLSSQSDSSLFDNAILFHIPDSREGWVESLEILLRSASNGGGITIVYDVSDVRPQGSPIRGFGGISSGPLPLVKLLGSVANLIKSESVSVTPTYSVTPITPSFAMEIDHQIAGAVIAGNVRRSARMSIMHWNDPFIEWFLDCKSDHMQHWSTNISVEIDNEFLAELLDEKSFASQVYERIIEGMVRDGEPGFYNSSLASEGELTHLGATNPCGEMPLESWESCNLGHINLAFGGDKDHRKAFRLMTRFLLRATFCDIQDPKQQEVVNRNRRIGVGFFGLQEWLGLRGISYSQFNRHGILADHLNDWYHIVREEADSYADKLGINRPIKCTTIAPTGTIAKLAGTSEGMQPIYAKYYLRRVRYSENDPEVNKLIDSGVPVEKDIYTPGTIVASFPCEDPILDLVPEDLVEEQHDISLETMLELQSLIQRYFVDNAISLTTNFPANADSSLRQKLSTIIRKYLPHIKGTTIFPEASRPQSPIERITKEKYESMVHVQVNSGESEQMIDECLTGACPIR